jgi:methionyl-tRNA formyltransferase
MKLVLVTPNEPFYLSDNINYLIKNLIKNNNEIVACVLLSPSPYGRRETFISKSKKVLNIFGLNFFLYYSLFYIKVKLF